MGPLLGTPGQRPGHQARQRLGKQEEQEEEEQQQQQQRH